MAYRVWALAWRNSFCPASVFQRNSSKFTSTGVLSRAEYTSREPSRESLDLRVESGPTGSTHITRGLAAHRVPPSSARPSGRILMFFIRFSFVNSFIVTALAVT
jgi:hypothetical protein